MGSAVYSTKYPYSSLVGGRFLYNNAIFQTSYSTEATVTTDIKFTSELATEWNGRGDITTVDGGDRIEQGIVLQILEQVPLRAPEPTPEAIESQRASIAEAVKDVDVVEPPTTVQVVASPLDPDETNDDPLSVTYAVETNRVTITLEAT